VRRRGTVSPKPAKKPQKRKPVRPKRSNAARAARPASPTLSDLQEQVSVLTCEVAEAREQQTATSEVLRAISSSPSDLKPVLCAICETVAKLCETKDAEIFIRHGDRLRLGWVQGPIGTETENWPITRGLVMGRAVLTRELIHVDDLRAAGEEYPGGYQSSLLVGHRTIIAVPLMRKGEAVGVLTLRRSEVKPFTDRQITLLRTFADQAVIAIENTRLLNELRESLQQQTATSEVLGVISSSPGKLEPVFEAMLGNATRICGAKFGVLWLAEGDGFKSVAMHGLPAAHVKEREREPLIRPAPEDPLGRLARTKGVVHIADLREEEAYIKGYPPLRALVDAGGGRTLLVVPMLKDNALVGAIAIYSQEVRPFSDKQIELLKNFAAQAVIAIENTRLLNELRQRTDDLSEALEQQTATAEVLRVVSSSPGELEPVFQKLLEKATRICTAKFGFMWRIEGGNARIVSKLGISQAMAEYLQPGPHRPALNKLDPLTVISRVIQSRQTVHITDYRADPSYIARDPLTVVDRLMKHFGRVRDHRPSSIPMQKIVAFALFSTRRQEEITLLRWDDLDKDRILVRDMKHPGDKKGNNVYCDLPPEALAIIKSMPRDAERIFPYSTDAISAAFTRACRLLGIEDLRFHDLRHEGISRLFEMGRTIPQVAVVSGHRSWTSLKRYTHIRQSKDKYENWNWLSLQSSDSSPMPVLSDDKTS
jgi:GAF domain-containing protein/integrase